MIENESDAFLWLTTQVEDDIVTNIRFFMREELERKKIDKKTHMGYRYNIVLFRSKEEETIDAFRAILGDPIGYVEEMSRMGYSGAILKTEKKTSHKKTVEVLTEIIKEFGFGETCKNIVKKSFLSNVKTQSNQ
jgi:hypothetical protein